MSRKADKVSEHRTAAGKHTGKIPSLTSVCTRQQRIAALAQKYIGHKEKPGPTDKGVESSKRLLAFSETMLLKNRMH